MPSQPMVPNVSRLTRGGCPDKRTGQDRRTLPSRQAVPVPRRGSHRLASALRLPPAAPRQRRTRPTGNLRTRGRGRPPDLPRHRGRWLLHPGNRPPTGRRPDLHTVWQTGDLAHIDDQPGATQRGIHRSGLLQPHRDSSRPRHEEGPPTSPTTGRRMGDHPSPADHRGTDVHRCEQDHDGQHQMESTARRARPVATERPC